MKIKSSFVKAVFVLLVCSILIWVYYAYDILTVAYPMLLSTWKWLGLLTKVFMTRSVVFLKWAGVSLRSLIPRFLTKRMLQPMVIMGTSVVVAFIGAESLVNIKKYKKYLLGCVARLYKRFKIQLVFAGTLLGAFVCYVLYKHGYGILLPIISISFLPQLFNRALLLIVDVVFDKKTVNLRMWIRDTVRRTCPFRYIHNHYHIVQRFLVQRARSRRDREKVAKKQKKP